MSERDIMTRRESLTGPRVRAHLRWEAEAPESAVLNTLRYAESLRYYRENKTSA